MIMIMMIRSVIDSGLPTRPTARPGLLSWGLGARPARCEGLQFRAGRQAGSRV